LATFSVKLFPSSSSVAAVYITVDIPHSPACHADLPAMPKLNCMSLSEGGLNGLLVTSSLIDFQSLIH